MRALVRRLGGPDGLVVCYEAGPCGYDLFRAAERDGCGVRRRGAGADPDRAGARVKTDRRDAKRLLAVPAPAH